MNNTKEKKTRFPSLRRNSAYDGQVSAALVGAIIGMLVGMLLPTVWAFIFKAPAYPLYAAPPLVMFCFIALLKGCRDVRALIITAILSLLGAYLTSISIEAAIYARAYGMSVLSVPLVALSSIGVLELLPGNASGYVFPLLFTATGYVLSWQLLIYGNAPASVPEEETVPEPAIDPDDDSGE